MNPALISALVGVSGVLGLISLVVYTYLDLSFKSARRSIVKIIGEEYRPQADEILSIISRFESDGARLEALKAILHFGEQAAAQVLTKIRDNIDVSKIEAATSKSGRWLSLSVGLFATILCIMAAAYSSRDEILHFFIYRFSPSLPSSAAAPMHSATSRAEWISKYLSPAPGSDNKIPADTYAVTVWSPEREGYSMDNDSEYTIVAFELMKRLCDEYPDIDFYYWEVPMGKYDHAVVEAAYNLDKTAAETVSGELRVRGVSSYAYPRLLDRSENISYARDCSTRNDQPYPLNP